MIMTAVATRPTNWKRIFITAGVVIGLGMLFLRSFVFPYQENRKKLLTVEDERDTRDRDYRLFQREKKRLESDRLLGLPNKSQAQDEYIGYLQKLLEKCGFEARPDVTPIGSDLRAAAGKKTGHVAVSFVVRAYGPWTSVVKFLEKFQRTPLLHRLRVWSVDVPGSTKGTPSRLTLNMTIEALMVNRNEKRPEELWGVDVRLVAVDALLGLNRMPAGWATLLRAQALLPPELPKRSYTEMPRLNPFVGGIPLSERDLAAEDLAKKNQAAKDLKNAQAKASLVFTQDSEPKEALLVVPTADGKKATSIKLKLGGTFPVWEGKNAKVLRIDHYKVYFQFDGKIHSIHIGEKMKEALDQQPLSASESKTLGLGGS
jgi:hypothetical protein